MTQAQRGDDAAFEQLVRRYQDAAFRTAYRITGEAHKAEDAAQEAFVKAYCHLARFRTGAPFGPWLPRIVVNEARNRRTAASRRAGLGQPVSLADARARVAFTVLVPDLPELACRKRSTPARRHPAVSSRSSTAASRVCHWREKPAPPCS